MELVSLVLSIIGAATVVVYLVRWLLYSPRVFIRIGGEQADGPIIVETEGQIPVAVGTKSGKEVVISKMWISANDEQVEVWARGVEKTLTTDAQFPLSLIFPDRRIVSQGHLQGSFFNYRAKGSEFAVKAGVLAQIEDTEQAFLIDMFAPRKVKVERILRFRADPTVKRTLQQSGIRLAPREALHVEGVQAQEAVWAAAEHGEPKLRVRELLRDDEERK